MIRYFVSLPRVITVPRSNKYSTRPQTRPCVLSSLHVNYYINLNNSLSTENANIQFPLVTKCNKINLYSREYKMRVQKYVNGSITFILCLSL